MLSIESLQTRLRRFGRRLRGRLRRPASRAFPGSGDPSVCIVAILKDEDPFVEEWVAYHRLLGVDHFYLYDNDPRQPLRHLLARHASYLTVVEWLVQHDDGRFEGRNTQLKAYRHWLDNFGGGWEWVAFVDGDEFIALNEHRGIREFLREFRDYDAVVLNWHVFGHNGYFENPQGLITESLTRRMREPRRMVKSISRPGSIAAIESAHECELVRGARRVDANKRPFRHELYPGKTWVARVNHYQCRSFTDWMKKPSRGEAGTVPEDRANAWRFTEEGCLRRFVTSIAFDKNEFVDTSMVPWGARIRHYLDSLG